MNAGTADRAQSSGGRKRHRACPYCPFSVFEKRKNGLTSKLGVLSQLGTVPASQTVGGSDPESSVAGGEQAVDHVGRKMLTCGRLPANVSYSIEAKQAKDCSQPEIAVGGLGDRFDRAFTEALAHLPRGVGVLADVERGVERQGASTPRQQERRQHNCQRDRMPHSSPHGTQYSTSYRTYTFQASS